MPGFSRFHCLKSVECGKIRTRITPNTVTFYAVIPFQLFSKPFKNLPEKWSLTKMPLGLLQTSKIESFAIMFGEVLDTLLYALLRMGRRQRAEHTSFLVNGFTI